MKKLFNFFLILNFISVYNLIAMHRIPSALTRLTSASIITKQLSITRNFISSSKKLPGIMCLPSEVSSAKYSINRYILRMNTRYFVVSDNPQQWLINTKTKEILAPIYQETNNSCVGYAVVTDALYNCYDIYDEGLDCNNEFNPECLSYFIEKQKEGFLLNNVRYMAIQDKIISLEELEDDKMNEVLTTALSDILPPQDYNHLIIPLLEYARTEASK